MDAEYWYGRMLLEGRGVPPSPKEGRAWISRAAASGMLDAKVALAVLLLSGRGGSRDHRGALALFREAAEQGHIGARFGLGAMLGGHDVLPDRPAAQPWYLAAAGHGHAHAELMLGRYLAHGAAGDPDAERARAWLARALRQSLAEARADLDALLRQRPEVVSPRPFLERGPGFRTRSVIRNNEAAE
ncbi:MAG: tetratricopeptide repeat protein [Acetobacteraceae bacterium]